MVDALTDRQRAVWRLLALGMTSKQAAAKLALSYSVVRATILDLHRLTGARNAVDLLHIALRCGGILRESDPAAHMRLMAKRQKVICWS